MSRAVIQDKVKLQDWVNAQQGTLIWAIATEGGRPPDDSWSNFVAIDRLPTDRNLLIRPKGEKGGVRVLLTESEMRRVTHLAPMGANQRELALDLREKEVIRREQELNAYESRLLAEHRSGLAELKKLSQMSDDRVLRMYDTVSKAESARAVNVERMQSLLEALQESTAQAARADEKNEIAAALTYTSDRIINALSLAKIRKIEDVPPDLLRDFQEFLQSKASRRYFQHMPSAVAKLASTFMELSKGMRNEFLVAIQAAMAGEKEREAAARPAG